MRGHRTSVQSEAAAGAPPDPGMARPGPVRLAPICRGAERRLGNQPEGAGASTGGWGQDFGPGVIRCDGQAAPGVSPFSVTGPLYSPSGQSKRRRYRPPEDSSAFPQKRVWPVLTQTNTHGAAYASRIMMVCPVPHNTSPRPEERHG
jgi:hypothetical protein